MHSTYVRGTGLPVCRITIMSGMFADYLIVEEKQAGTWQQTGRVTVPPDLKTWEIEQVIEQAVDTYLAQVS